VKRIRILLAEMPRMMREIVESAVSTQADMQIIGAIEERLVERGALTAAAEARVERADADVVILGLQRDDEARAYDRLLYVRPRLTLLAITGDGRGAFLYELRPHKVPIGDVSPEGLLGAIRTAARSDAGGAA
jgi:DNA-binding NarL/FixJ family response regulator